MSPTERDEIRDVLEREIIPRLDRIETQATTTNGRVTKLERWQAWLTGLAGGAFAVGLVADLGHRLGLLG